MMRRIIKINEDKCDGCGICATACHEAAIEIQNGKARLIKEDYCDGLGDCLPACPQDAITFETREAAPYDESAVKARLKAMEAVKNPVGDTHEGLYREPVQIPSMLNQWPIQIKLVPETAPYFQNADLLVAADCTAFSFGSFHHQFLKDHALVVGCPKLDDTDYSQKLAAILSQNEIKSITVLRMMVPCCGGMVYALKKAVTLSGKSFPVKIVTLSLTGEILGTEES